MTMRCMRYKPNKTATIFDFCGNCYEHGLPDEDREWSLDAKKKISRNPSSEPDVIARVCSHCFRTYSGHERICPYCGSDNGKTRKEIEEDKKAELERIQKIEKIQKRIEQGQAQTFEELVKLARSRGYKNPTFWASKVYHGRKR